MKHLLVLTVIFATAALGAMDTHLEGEPNGSGVLEWAHSGSKDIIVDNLCSSGGDIINGISIYNGNNWWCAIDWITDDDWSFEHWTWDIIPFGGYNVDTYMEIFETDLNTTPIDSFTISAGDISWNPAGYSAFGYTVLRGDCDVNPTTDPFNEGTTYWIALSMDLSDNALWMCWISVVDDYIYWYDGSAWYNAYDHFGEPMEGSYAIGGSPTVVESASLGEIKAAFK
ncbi:MAG: hypothetical protein GY771_17225 [bacterium]|nr:hypothetical protein [bacterium]